MGAEAVQAQEAVQVPLPQEPERDVVFFKRQGPEPAIAPEPMAPRHDLGKWWKNSEVVQKLQLTEAQITQLEQTFLDHRLKLIDLRADVERQEARLQPLIEADQIDEAKAVAQIDAVLAARAKLEKQNTMLMLSIRRVLSVEQWKKLQALHQERERVWFERRPEPGERGLMPPEAPMHRRTPAPTPRPPEL
jgi:Spy/CpxP family protein refolding chaperone